jgi:hypothetical protein
MINAMRRRWSRIRSVPWWVWALLAAWPLFFFPTARYFVGFEHVFGDDHEEADFWMAFVKSKPSWDVWFDVPAYRGLKVIPFDSLGTERQVILLRYCHARYGTQDVKQCYEHLEARD